MEQPAINTTPARRTAGVRRPVSGEFSVLPPDVHKPAAPDARRDSHARAAVADRLLRAAWLPHLARLALAAPFLLSGFLKLLDFPGAVAEVRGLAGLEPAALFAALVIATQLGGSALLLLGGRRAWVGAGLLAGFTVVATLLAHAWWRRTGIDRVRDLNIFWEHAAICGGLVLAAWASRLEAGR